MKIYLNREYQPGPWGGGTKFVGKLSEKLQQLNHQVVHNLDSKDVDIIFCFDPRPNSRGEWYETFLHYRHLFGAKIIQRVGDLGTHSKPELTRLVQETLKHSDHFIFPSNWAKDEIRFTGLNFSLIPNKPLKIFFENQKPGKIIEDKLKIVTHHWSTNPKKGFDFYSRLDEWCHSHPEYSFTYIGRLPDNVKFLNSSYIPPSDALFLSQELPRHHLYLTASREEAGANHVLEGLASGLPVVYHSDGGSIVEYCEDFGKSFNSFDTMIESIKHIKDCYPEYEKKLLNFNEDIDSVVNLYCEIICKLSST